MIRALSFVSALLVFSLIIAFVVGHFAHVQTAPLVNPPLTPIPVQVASRGPAAKPTVRPTPRPTPYSPPTATPGSAAVPLPAGILATPATSESGYWHTSGITIRDAHNNVVRIAAVTWYGMETTYWVPAGLDYQPYTRIMDTIKGLGYNAIRLPFSNQLVETNPIVTQHINANPQWRDVHALQVLDDIVDYARQIGLKVILDNHRSSAAAPKHVNILDEPLWYNRQYPQSSWINDWRTLALRYRGNDAVIGFDLRNEPHTDGPGPWNLHAYLHQGATWGPFDGKVSPATDWRLAAERAGNAVLAINPHLLIFVEGVQLYAQSGAHPTVSTYWWGSILTPIQQYPVVLKVAHQLVYSPHDWGPWKWNMSWFHNMTYTSMLKVWHRNWSFILDRPNAPYAAPIWIGELGTCNTSPGCIDRQTPGNQATWFHLLLQFLRQNREVGWSFFALCGTNANNHATNNGLLNPTWNGVSSQALQADLATIQH